MLNAYFVPGTMLSSGGEGMNKLWLLLFSSLGSGRGELGNGQRRYDTSSSVMKTHTQYAVAIIKRNLGGVARALM